MQDRKETCLAEQSCNHSNVPEQDGKRLTLLRNSYDPFIDFVKGVCILLVVLAHCLPPYVQSVSLFQIWGASAVPLFLLIQVFHAFKKGLDTRVNIKKLWERILKPFFFIELIIIAIFFAKAAKANSFSFFDIFEGIIKSGGKGPGSYYPWIYVQFALVLAVVSPVFKKLHGLWLALFFILLSQCFEIICATSSLPAWGYRIIFFRYTFILYLGYILATEGFVLDKKTILLSITSFICLIFFRYFDPDLRPFFYTGVWQTCHWICYYFMCIPLLFFIKFLFKKIYNTRINALFITMGQFSYEIFLFQMLYFLHIHPVIIKTLSIVFKNDFLIQFLSVLMALLICICPIIFYYNRKIKRRK